MKRICNICLVALVLQALLPPIALAQGDRGVTHGPAYSVLIRGGMARYSQGSNLLVSATQRLTFNGSHSIGLGVGYERFPDNNFVPVFIEGRTNFRGIFGRSFPLFFTAGAGFAVNFRSSGPITRDGFTDFPISPESTAETALFTSGRKITGRFHAGLGFSRPVSRDLSFQFQVTGRLHRTAFPLLIPGRDFPDLTIPPVTSVNSNSLRTGEDWEESLIFTLGIEFK